MSGGHERALAALKRRDRLRTLEARQGLDFASNDYLGLAASSRLADAARAALDRGVPVGAGASRLLRGNHPEHEALEAEAAAHFRAERALYFGGGFQANSTIFSTLPQRGDLVVHDELIHASAIDGIRASKAAHASVPHNDVDGVDSAIVSWRRAGGTGQPWIAVESLYSMDGDAAPLADLAALADRHDAMLVVDEAHATGVLGPDGRGLAAALEGRANVVSLHTCGKALGASGGLVLAPRVLADFLVNRGRAFIYATAPPPLTAAIVRESLRICRDEPERRTALGERIAAFSTAARSHIVPIVVGADTRAVALAAALRRRGFDVRAIRPPTVPEGTARLRITLTLNVGADDARALSSAINEEMTRLAA